MRLERWLDSSGESFFRLSSSCCDSQAERPSSIAMPERNVIFIPSLAVECRPGSPCLVPPSKPLPTIAAPEDLHQIDNVQARDRLAATMRKPVENIYASCIPGSSHPNRLASTNPDNSFQAWSPAGATLSDLSIISVHHHASYGPSTRPASAVRRSSGKAATKRPRCRRGRHAPVTGP